jgi:transcription elongation factor Elf1
MKMSDLPMLSQLIRAACLIHRCPFCESEERLLLGILLDYDGKVNCPECGTAFVVSEDLLSSAVDVIAQKYRDDSWGQYLRGDDCHP